MWEFIIQDYLLAKCGNFQSEVLLFSCVSSLGAKLQNC